jgi:soluble lytic murein transglycosylase-like protein
MRFWLSVFPDPFSPHPQPLSPKAERGENTILFSCLSNDLLTRIQLIRRHIVIGSAASFFSLFSRAGSQIEEPLADSARTALSSAVTNSAPPEPEFPDTASRIAYVRWLGEMSSRLGIITKQRLDLTTRQEFLQTVWYEARRAGLEASLVLGLIQVESAFRKHAVSIVGARGYMQVMPFWSRLIGDGDAGKLFHMQTNLRFGCLILRHYLGREGGDLFMALGRYNGSRGRAEYPNSVLAAKKRWD